MYISPIVILFIVCWIMIGLISVFIADNCDQRKIKQSEWFYKINNNSNEFLSNKLASLILFALGPIGLIFPLGINSIMLFVEKYSK